MISTARQKAPQRIDDFAPPRRAVRRPGLVLVNVVIAHQPAPPQLARPLAPPLGPIYGSAGPSLPSPPSCSLKLGSCAVFVFSSISASLVVTTLQVRTPSDIRASDLLCCLL
ncbi:hypothetical protein C8R44DRAFT_885268 [Mycena epipterygia]|nr:hypothetical protein C8R44DRAFT_885268 [Mycena epipterygia]